MDTHDETPTNEVKELVDAPEKGEDGKYISGMFLVPEPLRPNIQRLMSKVRERVAEMEELDRQIKEEKKRFWQEFEEAMNLDPDVNWELMTQLESIGVYAVRKAKRQDSNRLAQMLEDMLGDEGEGEDEEDLD